MKQLIILLLVLFQNSSFAQQKPASPSGSPAYHTGRGATPIQSEKQNGEQGNTYAVVVGISDYQDPGIPDLRFADKDAEAFANFLTSLNGPYINSKNVKLLLNNQATAASICIALDNLIEIAKEGDQIIIYFAGHGDVESKRNSQPGYLLAWDSPSIIYMAGGTINVRDLQDIVSTLSVDKKSKVLLYFDACHAGKLSGYDINGPQLTGQHLSRQFSNEVKILSCQPDEYSYEGRQWGGGHGVFSYYLIKGLSGLADLDEDKKISLFEIGRYLEDKIKPEVAPKNQFPLIIGNKSEIISHYTLPEIDSSPVEEPPHPVEQTFFPQIKLVNSSNDSILDIPDNSPEKLYFNFNNCLGSKKIMFYVNNIKQDQPGYADYYFNRLIKDSVFMKLHPEIRNNFVVALINESQQVINSILQDDPIELSLSKKNRILKYKDFPHYIESACGLLGEKHYLYNDLQARRLFFESYTLFLSNLNYNQSLGNTILDKLKSALKWNEDQPHVYLLMSLVYAYKMNDLESMERNMSLAIEQNKYWLNPYLYLVSIYSNTFKNDQKFLFYLDKGEALFPNSILLKLYRAKYFGLKRKFSKARNIFDTIFKMDSSMWQVYYEYANLSMLEKKYNKAEWAYKKVITLDSTIVFSYDALGSLYFKQNNFLDAENFYLKAINVDTSYRYAYENLSNLYRVNGQIDKSEYYINISIQLNPEIASGYYYRACILCLQNRPNEAYQELELALEKGFKQLDLIKNQNELKILKSNSEKWNFLMKKYFPEQF